jgi:serine/threonine protein kinase
MEIVVRNGLLLLGIFWASGRVLGGPPAACGDAAALLAARSHSRSTLDPGDLASGVVYPYSLSAHEAAKMATPVLRSQGYTEVSELGSGGMGAVVRAKDPLGKWKAIKFLLTWEPRRIAAFNAEAEVMNYLASRDSRFLRAKRSTLQTPDGTTLEAIEMPMVRGQSLDFLLKQNRLSSPELKRKIQAQIHSLVEAAHRFGIWHLDLKPANIMVDLSDPKHPTNPKVTLIDFGLSYRGPPPGRRGALTDPTVGGGVGGTLGFLRPERLFRAPPSEKDDIYALRMVDWKVRAGNDDRDRVIVRNLEPKELPQLSEAITGEALTGAHAFAAVPRVLVEGLEDESQFRKSFKDPAFALDSTGSLAERVVAMAEWSSLPTTVAERSDLLLRAHIQKPKKFLKFVGVKVARKAANPSELAELTTEILGSTVLIQTLSGSKGLKLNRETLDRIAKEAARQFIQTRFFDGHPESLGVLGPHPKLHFDLMKERVDALKAAGELSQGWGEYLAADPNL